MHPYIYYGGCYGGIARYVCELSNELWKMGHKIELPVENPESVYLQSAPFFKEQKEVPDAGMMQHCIAKILRLCGFGSKSSRYLMRSRALKALRNGKYDVIHPSYTNSTEILRYIKHIPLVATVHDMTHEIFPESFSSADPTTYRKKQFASQADKIIAISQQTRQDLIERFGIPEEKIDVIYHGNSLLLPADYESYQINVPERYILFVGHRFGYKNFTALLRAFAAIAAQDNELSLVCTGGPEFSQDEHELIKQLGIAHKVSHYRASDAELAILYNRCELFVYPSLYEGFGLPILEAFACGAPVLCTHASCFPEIGADGAAYFMPGNDDELAQSICSIIYCQEKRQQLTAAGRKRLEHFSWIKCAEQTLETYRAAIAAH